MSIWLWILLIYVGIGVLWLIIGIIVEPIILDGLVASWHLLWAIPALILSWPWFVYQWLKNIKYPRGGGWI